MESVEEIIEKVKVKPYCQTDRGVLFCADCFEILPLLKKESVDLVLTDPPYGIRRDRGFEGFGGFGKPIARRQYDNTWDLGRPSKIYFIEILRTSKNAIIFGGNFFADILPQGNHWIVWDKLNTMPSFGDCELLWTNIKRNSVKKIVYEYNGLLGKEQQRWHPTQKPVALIQKLLKTYSPKDDLVLDPFLGSGTVAVACERLGRRWIGIEISEDFCEIAKKRILKEANQGKLF